MVMRGLGQVDQHLKRIEALLTNATAVTKKTGKKKRKKKAARTEGTEPVTNERHAEHGPAKKKAKRSVDKQRGEPKKGHKKGAALAESKKIPGKSGKPAKQPNPLDKHTAAKEAGTDQPRKSHKRKKHDSQPEDAALEKRVGKAKKIS
jgi:hypothetical protein